MMNDAELAQVLGDAWLHYAYQIRSGSVAPFRMLQKEDFVNVTLFFNGQTLKVRETVMPDVDGYEAQIKTLEAKVKEQKEEIKSLNKLLDDGFATSGDIVGTHTYEVSKKDLDEAIAYAVESTGGDDLILITGSFYTTSPARSLIKGLNKSFL